MFWTVTLSILRGCGEAAKLFFLTLLFGLPLGLPIAFGSMSKWAPFRFLSYGQRPMGRFTRWLSEVKPIRALTNVIVWVIRGTPLVLQLIIIFYGPGLWFDHNPWNVFSNGRMFACALAFIINYACYFSVIYRGRHCLSSAPPAAERQRCCAALIFWKHRTPGQSLCKMRYCLMPLTAKRSPRPRFGKSGSISEWSFSPSIFSRNTRLLKM